MTKSQESAISFIRRFFESNNKLSNGQTKAIPDEITKWEVTEYPKFVSLTVATDQGTPGSLLHSLSHAYWLFFIGRNGGIVVKMCARSYEQFHGRKAFGMKFETRQKETIDQRNARLRAQAAARRKA